MHTMLQDLRYAVRALVRTPGFVGVALLTLSIGTGANATVFSFVNALLLRPAPMVADPSSLIAVYTSDFSSGPYGSTSYPDYLSLKSETTAFSGLAAFSESAGLLRDGETVERIRTTHVTGDFFDVIGVTAAQGRVLGAADVAADAPPAAMIGHDAWQRILGGNAATLGKVVAIDGQAHTIVGILPEGFDGLNLGAAIDVWTPLVRRSADPAERGNRGLSTVGRLRSGATLELAQNQLMAIAARLAAEYPGTNLGTLKNPRDPRPMFVVRHSRLHPQFRGPVAMVGAVLMSAVALVLVVACANVANLMLSRTTARGREIAIRLALGASRRRVIRQLLTESVLLGAAGGALGVLFALWTADVLPSFFPAEQQRILDARVDARVLSFTALLSIAAGILFGLVPALHALRPSAAGALRADGGRVSDKRTGLVRAGLVLSQVALTFVLLVSAGLLVRSLSNALQADLGFSARDAVLVTIEVPAAELKPEQGAIFYQDALARVRALPGIESAALVRTPVLSGGSRRGFRIEGYQPRPGEDTELNINSVDAGYFETMGIPLIEGRAFDERDRAGGVRVVIVNDIFAQRYFGGRAVGRRVQNGNTALEIVGVVRNGKYRSVREPALPYVYYPFTQNYTPRMTLVARTSGDAAAQVEPVRRTVRAIHASVAVFRTTTLMAHLEEVLSAERLTAALVAASGAMALLLAIVGVYGVIAYGVVRRTREIGVRIALGARPVDVTRLVVSEGLQVTLAGIGGGVVAALGVTRLLASMLYGVSPWDAVTFVAAAALLAAIALLAAWLPTQRAVRLDAAIVLRQE